MNQELKKQHLQELTNQSAVAIYHMLADACEAREGGMTDADQLLVADVARAEQIKQTLIEDIRVRGIGKERSNGRQTYYQENKSVAQVRAYAEQQRKLLNELKLTPVSRKAAIGSLNDDGFDEF